MGWFSNNEDREAFGMRELKKSIQETLDTLEDELEETQASIEAKEDEIAVSQSELAQLRGERQRKQNDIARVEASLRLIANKRGRNPQ